MKILKYILALAAVSVLTFDAGAVRALDRYVTVTQPDGSVIHIKRVGDEFAHFSVAADDAVLAEVGEAFYFGKFDSNGNIVPTGQIAADPDKRTKLQCEAATIINPEQMLSILRKKGSTQGRRIAQSGMGRFASTFPSRGDVKSIVILVSYKDIDFNLDDPYGYFNGLLNADGFSEYGATGCVAEYFRYNSSELFRPQFDVVGPVVLPHARSYYGSNNSNGNDRAAYEMVVDAVKLLDASVDFSQYDMDHDGEVDNIYVIYAGEGEASGGIPSTVWPHSWKLSQAGVNLEADGMRINSYGCSNEWFDNQPCGMGTFTHEFAHVIGLPDLYSTSYNGSYYATPGPWSVLDYGPYNNDGHTPPAFSAYERLAMGWIDPDPVVSRSTCTLDNLADSNKAYIIPTSTKSEYYLLENRQLTGWDSYLPGRGMLIWHVDYVKSVFEANEVNNNRNHMYVELKKASNIADAVDMSVYAGWCWPGPSGATEFTDVTSPSMITWKGEALNLPVTGIEMIDGLVKFDVGGGAEKIAPPEALVPVRWDDDWFEAVWKESDHASDYYLTVLEKKAIGEERTYINDMGEGSVITMPDGWSASSAASYSTSGNYGKSAPSFKMSTDGCSISTPVYEGDITGISFWSKGINCDGTLEITGTDHEGGIRHILSLTPPKKAETVTIDSRPGGLKQISFVYLKNTGNIAIDDIEIAVSGYSTQVLPGYNRLSTQGLTSMRVDHPSSLETHSTFSYYVEATDGEFVSRPSGCIEVPSALNGIETIGLSADYTLSGRTLYLPVESTVLDLYGRIIFKGKGEFTLPAPGIYILRQPLVITKISVSRR